MLRRLYPFWRPARGTTVAGLALLALAGALELLLPWPVKWLVDGVFGSAPAPGWLAWIWPEAAGWGPREGILAVCAAVFGLGAAHKLAFAASHLLLIRAGLETVRNLRCRVFDHLQRLSLAYHDKTKVGDSIYRAAYDTYAAQTILSQALAPVVSGVLVLGGVLVVMARIDGVLTTIALLTVPALALNVRLSNRSIERRSRRYHEQEGALASALQEALTSIRVIKAFTRETESLDRFAAVAGHSAAENARLSRAQLAFSAGVGLTTTAATTAAILVGAQRVIEGRLLIGDVLVFLSYLGMLYTPVSAFAQSSGVLLSARTQLRRVFEVLDTAPDVTDRPGAAAPRVVTGRVTFRDVEFGYEPGRPVLRGLELDVPAGSVVAVVGRTGAGKSTLAGLLPRFYDPDAGAVFLDGRDLRDLPVEWLRRQVGLVLQDPMLLSGTVAENIAFGRPDAPRALVVEAARRAQADEFIQGLPDGYDSMLGERGVNLSGGQRQRIAIARAFLKDAPVLILDEPTSALDPQTEAALLGALSELVRGRTTFIIAHRLSTVRHADVILVMDGGRVLERGSHRDLMGRNSAYRELHRAAEGVGPSQGPGPATAVGAV